MMKIIVAVLGVVGIAVLIPVTAAVIMDFVKGIYLAFKGGR